MNQELIYLDHAATTPLEPKVLKKMLPYLRDNFGNAGSIHTLGQQAKNALENARRTVAEILHCAPEEIIFTSCGTESDNLALRGVFENVTEKSHLIISAIEHHAILHTAKLLKKHGVELTKIPVDKNGIVDPDEVMQAIQPNTKLISIMLANNEIGTLQPIREIGKMLQKRIPEPRAKKELIFHTDAVQGGGILNLDTRHLKVDLLSLSAHKFYGPKGVGILFKKRTVNLAPQISGGEQERNQRAGTENVAGIVGAAEALQIAEKNREKEFSRLEQLRDYFIEQVLLTIPKSKLNGDPKNRLPNNANFSFFGIEGESILLRLDFENIAASSGSACTSGSLEPSHVLRALKVPHEWLHGTVRFTLGKSTTKEDLDRTVKVLKKIVKSLRAISPIF